LIYRALYLPIKTGTMSEKKAVLFESPNLSKLQSVVIDSKTTIYIALDADPVEAKKRYLTRINRKAITLS
jgi:hypothetical protein